MFKKLNEIASSIKSPVEDRILNIHANCVACGSPMQINSKVTSELTGEKLLAYVDHLMETTSYRK